MIEAILFDVDGVIVDSEDIYCTVMNAVFKPYGVSFTRQDFVNRWMLSQRGTQGVIEDYTLDTTVDHIRNERTALIADYLKDVKLMPYAREVITELSCDYALGAVSSSKQHDITVKLGKFNLLNTFRVIISQDDITNKKPDPEGYNLALERLQVRPEHALVIEDTPTGIDAGNAAGCITVAYPNKFLPRQSFTHADYIIDSLREIPQIIAEYK